jgi:hypothetical protein
LRLFKRRHGVAMRALIQASSTLTHALGGTRIAALDPVSLEGYKGVGVLREATGHGFSQTDVAGSLEQQGLRQLQVEGRRVARQQQVVLVCPALGSQRIGHAAQEHLPR